MTENIEVAGTLGEESAMTALKSTCQTVANQVDGLAGCFYCRRVVEAVKSGAPLVVGGVEIDAATALWHVRNCWVMKRITGSPGSPPTEQAN